MNGTVDSCSTAMNTWYLVLIIHMSVNIKPLEYWVLLYSCLDPNAHFIFRGAGMVYANMLTAARVYSVVLQYHIPGIWVLTWY